MKTFRQYLKEDSLPYRFDYVNQHGDVIMYDDVDAKEDADAIKRARIQWEKLLRRGEAGPGTDIAEIHVKRISGRNSYMRIRTIY